MPHMTKPPKTWYEVICAAPDDSEDIVAEVMMNWGAIGTWSEDAKDPGFKRIHGYFEVDLQTEHLLVNLSSMITQIIPTTNRITIFGQQIEESDWLAEWKKHHKPEKVGKSLHILPSWCDPSNISGAVVRIDPGMAFGTGGHPTTKLCLTVLEEVVEDLSDPGTLSMMDLGCGSGILSIAGSKLGMGETVGIDDDPVALENAQRNVELNEIEVEFLREIPKGRKFNLVVSNIYAETHLQLRDSMMPTLKEEGWLILSGILSSKKGMVRDAFESPDLRLVEEREENGWICFLFQKRKK